MVVMDIADLDRDPAGHRNSVNDHDPRWLRSPSSTVTIGPSNWVIALKNDPDQAAYSRDW